MFASTRKKPPRSVRRGHNQVALPVEVPASLPKRAKTLQVLAETIDCRVEKYCNLPASVSAAISRVDPTQVQTSLCFPWSLVVAKDAVHVWDCSQPEGAVCVYDIEEGNTDGQEAYSAQTVCNRTQLLFSSDNKTAAGFVGLCHVSMAGQFSWFRGTSSSSQPLRLALPLATRQSRIIDMKHVPVTSMCYVLTSDRQVFAIHLLSKGPTISAALNLAAPAAAAPSSGGLFGSIGSVLSRGLGWLPTSADNSSAGAGDNVLSLHCQDDVCGLLLLSEKTLHAFAAPSSSSAAAGGLEPTWQYKADQLAEKSGLGKNSVAFLAGHWCRRRQQFVILCSAPMVGEGGMEEEGGEGQEYLGYFLSLVACPSAGSGRVFASLLAIHHLLALAETFRVPSLAVLENDSSTTALVTGSHAVEMAQFAVDGAQLGLGSFNAANAENEETIPSLLTLFCGDVSQPAQNLCFVLTLEAGLLQLHFKHMMVSEAGAGGGKQAMDVGMDSPVATRLFMGGNSTPATTAAAIAGVAVMTGSGANPVASQQSVEGMIYSAFQAYLAGKTATSAALLNPIVQSVLFSSSSSSSLSSSSVAAVNAHTIQAALLQISRRILNARQSVRSTEAAPLATLQQKQARHAELIAFTRSPFLSSPSVSTATAGEFAGSLLSLMSPLTSSRLLQDGEKLMVVEALRDLLNSRDAVDGIATSGLSQFYAMERVLFRQVFQAVLEKRGDQEQLDEGQTIQEVFFHATSRVSDLVVELSQQVQERYSIEAGATPLEAAHALLLASNVLQIFWRVPQKCRQQTGVTLSSKKQQQLSTEDAQAMAPWTLGAEFQHFLLKYFLAMLRLTEHLAGERAGGRLDDVALQTAQHALFGGLLRLTTRWLTEHVEYIQLLKALGTANHATTVVSASSSFSASLSTSSSTWAAALSCALEQYSSDRRQLLQYLRQIVLTSAGGGMRGQGVVKHSLEAVFELAEQFEDLVQLAHLCDHLSGVSSLKGQEEEGRGTDREEHHVVGRRQMMAGVSDRSKRLHVYLVRFGQPFANALFEKYANEGLSHCLLFLNQPAPDYQNWLRDFLRKERMQLGHLEPWCDIQTEKYTAAAESLLRLTEQEMQPMLRMQTNLLSVSKLALLVDGVIPISTAMLEVNEKLEVAAANGTVDFQREPRVLSRPQLIRSLLQQAQRSSQRANGSEDERRASFDAYLLAMDMCFKDQDALFMQARGAGGAEGGGRGEQDVATWLETVLSNEAYLPSVWAAILSEGDHTGGGWGAFLEERVRSVDDTWTHGLQDTALFAIGVHLRETNFYNRASNKDLLARSFHSSVQKLSSQPAYSSQAGHLQSVLFYTLNTALGDAE